MLKEAKLCANVCNIQKEVVQISLNIDIPVQSGNLPILRLLIFKLAFFY